MNFEEYQQIKNYSYDEYCNYLKEKYGEAKVNYMNENWNRNKEISRTTEGLYAHHICENKAPNLSCADLARDYPYEYQFAKNIVYCDLLEHLLLHILIGETPNISYNLGIGGARILADRLRSYYQGELEELEWEDSCLALIDEDEDVFELLLERSKKRSILLEHNVTIYNQLEEVLINSNKALVIIGTGGGKTTTALEYLRIHDFKALVLCPTKLIQDGWSKYDNVDTLTHAGFRNKYKEINYNNYQVIIIDEAHHCSSANVTGKALKWTMENTNLKFIGLTAEEKRNDGIKVASDLYDDNVCEGITVLSGIQKGILHPFSYVGAYYDTIQLREEYKSDELFGELDLALNNTPTLKEILLRNMPKGKRKGIIFVSNIAAIPEAVDIMKDIYPNIEYRAIHSKLSLEENEQNKEWFKNTDEGYLLSINMISEGAHYPGVNTLIMFRHTESPLVFNQQLGRIITLAKYQNPHAIVFDLVNNAMTANYHTKSIKVDKDLFDTLKEIAERQNNKSEQIIIKDYTEDIVKVLQKIKENNSNNWEDWEDEILIKYYSTEGVKGCIKRLAEEREKRYGK